jgi:UDP-N-acetylmuramate: L-alanyl-gamma-D-glutamyl-meso-diaminopimelate ligase
MKVHILGICGTFMGGIALLGKASGYDISGSDTQVYPPMSDLLSDSGIALTEGYDVAQLQGFVGQVVVGNVMRRGIPAVEYLLDQGMDYLSGPQWLAETILRKRHVLAVAGTHGKTTTASMLAWILDQAGLDPGFLIGGVPLDFGVSARLGSSKWFVVEADEYDTAFFDKRSKFVHYRPRTVVLNNLEYDHADIFPDIGAIQTQFHHLIRMIPQSGLIISKAGDQAMDAVLEKGCWTPVQRFSGADDGRAEWAAQSVSADQRSFDIAFLGEKVAHVSWSLQGRHNLENALAAVAAAHHAGVSPKQAGEALSSFRGVKRRMELKGVVRGVSVYDDFAHHPTAVARTLEGLRARVGQATIRVAFEMRSNTMRMGVHDAALPEAFDVADRVYLMSDPAQQTSVSAVAKRIGDKSSLFDDLESLVTALANSAQEGDHLVIMSNGGFGGIHSKLLAALGREQ